MTYAAPRRMKSARVIAGRRNESWQERARCAAEFGPAFDREPVIVQVGCCRACPVKAECLDYALRTERGVKDHSVTPIYGGTTYGERVELRRAVRS